MLLATGGFGRMFRITSNAWSLTGDGAALAYRHGVPLEDMEFYQFHPTGLYGLGILLSEAARGEGGILLNGKGERFMERYAPTLVDLAPRDIVSRAMYLEIRDGRGVEGKDYLYLDVRHLGRAVIEEKLPDITDFARVYLGVEPLTEPVPIQPTAHYAMGGIPTDNLTRGSPATPPAPSCRACTRPGSAPVSASTARTAWGRTRWWTCSSSAGVPGARWRPTSGA